MKRGEKPWAAGEEATKIMGWVFDLVIVTNGVGLYIIIMFVYKGVGSNIEEAKNGLFMNQRTNWMCELAASCFGTFQRLWLDRMENLNVFVFLYIIIS